MRELYFLLVLGETQNVSQHKLARKIGVSSAMANNYMQHLVRQGLVTASGPTNRSMKYTVTADGSERLAGLLRVYSKEIARLYSIAKCEVEKRLQELYGKGFKTVVLFGAAETGELIYNAARATPMRIVGWVDNDVAKHRLHFGDLHITAPETIESFRPDGVLIASSGRTDDIQRQLSHLSSKGIQVATL